MTVVDTPDTIDPTGTSDTTAALHAFIAAQPDGTTIRLAAGATYLSDGTLILTDRTSIDLDGNGATIRATPGTGTRTRSHLRLIGGRNIRVRNLNIRGANPHAGTGDAAYNSTKEAQHGVEVFGTIGVELDNVTITDTYGDFVYLGRDQRSAAPGNGWTRWAWIHHCVLERNGRQGIAVTGAADVAIEDNHISQTRRATFDLEPNGAGWGANRVRIENNDIGPGRLLFLAAKGSGPVGNVAVLGNRLAGKALTVGWTPPVDQRRHGLVLRGNVSDTGFGNAGGAAIYIYRTTAVAVVGNTQRLQLNRGMAGVETREGAEMVVAGNTFPGAVEEWRNIDPA